MFGFRKKKSETSEVPETPLTEEKKIGFFNKLKTSLKRTRGNFNSGLSGLLLRKSIDDELLEDIETLLLVADVGVDATAEIIDHLTDKVSRKQLNDTEALLSELKNQLLMILEPRCIPLILPENGELFTILMIGVNGVGKTTTIGKLAKQFQDQGKSVMLAAGDTFRAAAVEQLISWGARNQIPVVAQETGADSASVIFDAIQSAKAKKIDVLIADTAGRLHTKSNLMEELRKIKRVMEKAEPTAPHEVMLVIDACTGQNALNQAQIFNESVTLTGLTITKLDGTAKGGIIFSIAKKLGIPIRYIGIGEGIDDLRHFEAADFVNALFEQADT